MPGDNTKEKVVRGFFWRYLEKALAQAIQMLVTLVLARILMPEEYGMISLVTVFINVAMVFVQSGFGSALIQKKDAEQKDFSTVFWFSLFLGGALYGVMFAAAPLIGRFYHYKTLTPVIRVLSLTLILAGANTVQQAYVSRTMQFKKFFFASVGGTLLSAFTGIGAALCGMGIWALVIQQLTDQIMDTVILWFTAGWRPTREFSPASMKKIYTYGWKLLCSALLDTVYNNLYTLVIGKKFRPTDVGYYDRGKQFPALIIGNINVTIQSVMFPALSSVQSDTGRLKTMTRRTVRTSTFVIFPCMGGLAAVAHPLVLLLLTEKWLPAVEYLRYYCFIYALWPVHTANLQAINAVGRSDIFLKLEIIKKCLGVLMLVVTVPLGIHAMMAGCCVNAVIGLFLNVFPNKKLLDYRIRELLQDIAPATLLSAAMFLAVSFLGTFLPETVPGLLTEVLAGAVVYIAGAALFRVDSLDYLIKTIRSVLHRSPEKNLHE